MPDILTLEALDWTLTVWTKDTVKAVSRLKQTLDVRGKTAPATLLRFNPPLGVFGEDRDLTEFAVENYLLFFENKLYEFEFTFTHGLFAPEYVPFIKHRLSKVEDAFHFSERSQLLRGSIDFGNDIGWFRLKLAYYTPEGKPKEQTISFEVWPLKMDMETDLNVIQQVIDRQYPLWRFALSNKTELELERSRKPHERFPLLWLAQFSSLREELEKGVKEILNAPHRRLQSYPRHLRAERLKKRLNPKLEEQITNDLTQGITHRRYQFDQRKLSTDTPENRFIKQVLKQCVREIGQLTAHARRHDKEPEQSRFSKTFYEELEQWQQPLQKQLNHPLFRELGKFNGLSGESLVLHQRPGYAQVYRVWQQLRMYLDVLGQKQDASISVKSIAELYEVWCFLEVRRILTEVLGFAEITASKAQLKAGLNGLSFKDGRQAGFKLKRDDISINLSHEPVFSCISDVKQGVYSWTTTQKPDILLEVTFDDRPALFWVFDAKYRIAGNEEQDVAPDDAINQMHRYRDALVYADSQTVDHRKSRPVYGAFVLYPGWFDEKAGVNPAQASIDAVGIGAFPLLPGASGPESGLWLTEFLRQQFGAAPAVAPTVEKYRQTLTDRHYVQEAVRIGYGGMEKPVRYKDLTLVTALGGGRTAEYMEGFRTGKARWYHMPVATTEKKLLRIAHHVMGEIRYCALTVHIAGTYQREIRFVYPVVSIQRVMRRMISREQAGSGKIKKPEQEYWLFEFGAALADSNICVEVPGHRDATFKFMLTGLDDLKAASEWKTVHHRYASLLK